MSILSEWSLWLEPAGEGQTLLRKTVETLAAVSPASPPFAPHITLYSKIDYSSMTYEALLAKVQMLVGELRMKELHLAIETPTSGETYFQSVLLPITPSGQLRTLRSACSDAFGSVKEYFPHISLKYGDFEPARKEEIARGSIPSAMYPPSITVSTISIVRCVGKADEWEVVGSVPLSPDCV